MKFKRKSFFFKIVHLINVKPTSPVMNQKYFIANSSLAFQKVSGPEAHRKTPYFKVDQ